MKRTVLKCAVWIITILWMIMIFFFSAQNAAESDQTSESFTAKVLSVFPSFRELPQERQAEAVENIQTFVRKTAHFSLYAGLGFWIYLSLCFLVRKTLRLCITPLFCLLYAVSDEIHQLFSDGRSCEVADMALDTLGACAGMGLAVLCVFLARLFAKKRCAAEEKGV